MVVKNLAAALVSGLFLSVAGRPAPAAAQQPKSVASDSVFIQRASSIGLLQVKLGQLAAKKGTSPAVVPGRSRSTVSSARRRARP